MNQNKSIFRSLDGYLYLILFCLMITSLTAIYSASRDGQYIGDFVSKQAIFYVIGFILSVLISRIDIEQLYKISWVIFTFCLVLLLFLIIAPESIAREINGAKAWYQIPLIGSLQPSEFMKISLIISISYLVDQHYEKYEVGSVKYDLFLIGKISLLAILPTIIVLKQPDTGMTLIYLFIISAILICSKIKISIILSIFSIPFILLGGLVFTLLKFPIFFEEKILSLLMPHQRSRIYGWLDPFQYSDEGFQTKQGLLAIGSGKLSGKGYLDGVVYIPEEHTDFIFANIAEEFGFLGASFVLILFFFLLSRILTITLKIHQDKRFGMLICVGALFVLAYQIIQNIGMTIGLLPVTGITLPFLSYGGSSLLSNMMLIGLIQSVKNSYKDSIFY